MRQIDGRITEAAGEVPGVSSLVVLGSRMRRR
jgi:hypothetical protein